MPAAVGDASPPATTLPGGALPPCPGLPHRAQSSKHTEELRPEAQRFQANCCQNPISKPLAVEYMGS